ncbi:MULTISPECIES: ankyrin repeat domain-containing protein [unclassified Zobellia]|uniref:ankyrin repeat domain-containing protein n=1 Tax=unclassified Zobellia TaxID=2620635 RepID=UPI001C0681E2|nr:MULTISPECIES: ankyrin repeat domain-containing protein [unclassified Zobellia]MBU2972750.1 ankyrin repeat domain-containing protein [Zobellia sp. B3R18]MDO6820022.1 ankyrin repeat domain-containing protein [Zobellia sp. 1_MG-2023]
MRKTFLTFATACLVGTSAIMANDTITTMNTSTYEMFRTVELSSFCKAIMQGDLDTVKKFIELGEDVNKKSMGMTPAIFAARYNKAEILELLIANGANLKIKSDKGYSVKKYAELSNATDALRVIETAMGS